MSDEELAALRRRAATDSSAGACLALARALERAGDRDAALDALLPARDDPTVREEIARWPAWTHGVADAGFTSFVDLPPIARAPRVAFRARLRRRVGTFPEALRATPLGLVVAFEGEREDQNYAVCLDPKTGAVRHELGPFRTSDVVCLGSVVLFATTKGVRAFDLWTGEPLYHLPDLKAAQALATRDRRWLVLSRDQPGPLAVWEVGDPRRPPVGPRILDAAEPMHRVLAGGCALAIDRGRLSCHDLATGVLRWTQLLGGNYLVHADETGVVTVADEGEPGAPVEAALRAYDLEGRLRFSQPWRGAAELLVFAVTPSLVLSWHYPETERFFRGQPAPEDPILLVARSRETGAVLWSFVARGGKGHDESPALGGVGNVSRRVTVARDVVYLEVLARDSLSIVAVRDGAILWRLPLRDPDDVSGTSSIAAVAAGARSLDVLTQNGTLIGIRGEV